VVSAAITGRVDSSGAIASRLPRPVSSVFLAQGAMSLWSYAAHSDISHPEIAHLFWSAVQAGA
jgi:hypothetical protein